MRTACATLALVLVAAAGCGDQDASVAAGDAEQEFEVVAIVLEDESHGPELCLGGVMTSDPIQCGGPAVTNWDWAQVPWREEKLRTRTASAVVRGTYDGEAFTLTPPPREPGPDDREEPEQPPDFSPACDAPQVVDASHGMVEFEEAAQHMEGIPQRVAVWVNDESTGADGFSVNVIVRPGAAGAARDHVRARYLGPLCLEERDLPTAEEIETVHARVREIVGDEHLFSSADERRGVVEVTVVLETDEMRRAIVAEFGEGVVEVESRLRPVP